MRERFRDSMTWLHTWSGLLVGWVLLAIFFTGTLAFFQGEITRWMQPDLQQRATAEQAIGDAQAYLSKQAPEAQLWSITLPSERYAVTSLFWRPSPQGGGFARETLDGSGQPVALRDTEGGYFLYRFHFDLHYMPVRWARWIVGVCSMLMLLAIITGIIIHKKIFKDFFTLQWRKGYRSWLDGHTITSVLALPFHLMITYTGLVTLMLMYMSSAITLVYDDRGQFFDELQGNGDEVVAEDKSAAPLTDLQQLYNDAQQRMRGAPISFARVDNPGQQQARITFFEAPTQGLVPTQRQLTYSAVSGELLRASELNNAAEQTRRTMINLHSGRFADDGLRWLYFLSGVLGTIMVASGLVLWFQKRRQKLQRNGSLGLGHRLVDRLNAGFIMGLPLATAGYFLSNRLLPLTMHNRSEWEIHCFFLAWLASIIYAFVAGPARTWRHLALVAGALFLVLPLLGIVLLDKHILSYELGNDLVLLAGDLTIAVSGALLLLLGGWLTAKQRAKRGDHVQPTA